MRFTVSFADKTGRQFQHFHSWSQASTFAALHNEWIQDHLMQSEFHPTHSDPDNTPFLLSEVTEVKDVAPKTGGGGGRFQKRLAVVAPGLHQAATAWSAVCQHKRWHDCHLKSWAGAAYHFQSHDALRRAALALGLPLYGRVLQRGSCPALSLTESASFLAGLDAPVCVPLPASSASVTFQTCAKCGQVKLGQEITTGGLCYRCSYAQQIAPGIWQDLEGGVHFDVPALLSLFDIPDTPENREAAAQTVHGALSRQVPNSLLQIRRGASSAN